MEDVDKLLQTLQIEALPQAQEDENDDDPTSSFVENILEPFPSFDKLE